MGNVRKIGEEYIIEFYARGLRYQQKAGSDREKAEELLRATEEKIAKGEMALIVRDVDADIFLEDFLLQAKGQYSAKTLSRYRSVVRHFSAFLKSTMKGALKLSQVTPQTIEQYKSSLLKPAGAGKTPAKPNVINLALLLLRDVFDYAIKQGYLNDNPVFHTRLIKVDVPFKTRTLSQKEIDMLLKHASRDLSRLIEMILLMGISAQELVDLAWSDIDFGANVVRIYSPTTKEARTREIPLGARSLEIFQSLKKTNAVPSFVFPSAQGEKMSVRVLAKQMDELAQSCCFAKRVTFENLRVAFAGQLIRKRMPLSFIQKILGHDDIAKTLPFAAAAINELSGNIYGV